MLGRRIPVVVGLAVVLAACGASPALRAARQGDRTALKSRLASLSRSGLHDVAEAALERELASARGTEALARIDDARRCALPLADAFEALASAADAVGAAATLALLDAGGSAARAIDRESLLTNAGASHDPLWRAAAARASGASGSGTDRARYYRDPDERVRLAALRSALEKPNAGETRDLVEVTRLDPNVLAQSLAARALGAIGGATVVLSLRDRYELSSDELRATIVSAWAMPASAKSGGTAEIVRVAEVATGLPAIEAGSVLLAAGGETRATGLLALVRTANEAPTAPRAAALGRLPIDVPDARHAIERAATSEDVSVKTAALTRLLELPQARAATLAELERLTLSGTRIAAVPLAKAGDKIGLNALRSDLGAPRAEARLTAGRMLVSAGALTDAAALLADDDPRVRTSTACALLLATR